MQTLSSWLAGFGAWNWFILAVALFALETVVPGVHFIWFGLAAIIVGILGLATGFVWQWQLIAFALLSVITVFWVRRYAQPNVTKSDLPDLNVRGAQYIGRRVVVDGRVEPLGDARYLLSPGDLYALEQIPEIMKIGISALKIEGRYKDADYVALTTRHTITSLAQGGPPVPSCSGPHCGSGPAGDYALRPLPAVMVDAAPVRSTLHAAVASSSAVCRGPPPCSA